MDNLYTLCAIHGPGEAKVCAACHQAICPQCATVIEEDTFLCPDCLEKLAAQDTSSLFDDFWNPKKSPVTFGLAALLLLLYAASTGLLSLDPMAWVVDRVNLDTQAVLMGAQWDRLLWANVFHASMPHIASNVFALLIFGQMLERLVGSGWTLFWLVLGLLSTDAATLWWGPRYSLGASGMVYALQTGFIVTMVRRELFLKVQPLKKIIQSFAGYVVLMVVVNLWYGQIVNIAGHAGGAIAGGLGAALYPFEKDAKVPWLFASILLLACLGLLFARFYLRLA